MTSLSFLLPFAHWDTGSPVPHGSTITVAKFLQPDTLALGLSCGELLLLSASSSSTSSTDTPPANDHTLRPHARLSGHRSPILSLAALPTRTESGAETLLLSLDSSSRMSKWSLRDGRCLQSAPATLASRPKGFRLALPGHILVYGCSTEIAVLSAETLQRLLQWTGSVDWPLPAAGSSSSNEVLTWTPAGLVQGWVLRRRAVERQHHRLFTAAGGGDAWGGVLGFECAAAGADYVLVQRRGVSVYAADGAPRGSVEVDAGREIAGYEVGRGSGVVFVWAANGDGWVVRRGEGGVWRLARRFGRPWEDGGAVVMAFSEGRGGRWVVAAFDSQRSSRGGLAVGVFSLDGGDIEWRDNKALFAPPPPEDGEPTCTSSALFANLLVFAHGPVLHLHTLSSFLLTYASPTSRIPLPATPSSRICLLRRVRIGEYTAPGRHKEHLVVGTTAGELFIVDSPGLQPTRRLPLSATPLASANILPATLGKRLRSTLFVSAADGTASIVDVERARIMATFPSHDYLHLTSVATKPAQNVVLLTYEDGARREWDLGEEEGGVLKPPPPSSGSGSAAAGGGGGGVYAADLADEGWHELRVGAFEHEHVEDGEEENEGPAGMDAAVKACLRFCEEGLPAMVVDVKGVLDTLQGAVDVARRRARRGDRVVVGNHPAVVAARALLTALVPGGADVLLGEEEGERPWRAAVEGCFLRARGVRAAAALGQIGAGKHVSLLAPGALERLWGVGGTVSGIVLLAGLALVGGLLAAAGKEGGEDEVFGAVVERAVENVQRDGAGGGPALGVFAKYWMDRNLLVRKTARVLMKVCMQRLTDGQRDDAVSYWSRFLPVLVPPELYSSKDVVRSVVILGKLTADYAGKIEQSVKKNVALSVELLLGDANPHFQDTAIELVGDGWAVFQSLFDPAEVIHILIRISSTNPDSFPDSRRQTLHTCILSIARTNSPLLGSGLANNIAHGTSSPPQPSTAAAAATTQSAATPICVSAMRLVTAITRTDPHLLHGVAALVIAAVVKILDPSSPLRERVLPAVTELVNSLVDAYPGVAFHRPTQRLALSAAPGAVLVFDLKAACEMNVLQGHGGTATWLAFSADGRYVAGVDVEEGCVLVWRFVSGLLSFIGGSDGPPGVLMPRRREALGGARAWRGVVAVEWTGERSVEVRAGAEAVVIANVEAGKEGWGIL